MDRLEETSGNRFGRFGEISLEITLSHPIIL